MAGRRKGPRGDAGAAGAAGDAGDAGDADVLLAKGGGARGSLHTARTLLPPPLHFGVRIRNGSVCEPSRRARRPGRAEFTCLVGGLEGGPSSSCAVISFPVLGPCAED